MAILTVSREFGSGGREIGRAVAGLMGYEYVNKERILDDIRASGKEWEEWSKDLDEHNPTTWEKYDWSFRGFGALIQSHVLNHALKDNVVIMGRGGNFLLKDIPHALSIRVTAPLEQRIERIIKRESVDRGTALWLAEKTDKERAGFILALYHKHWEKPSEYDMTFDLGTKNINEIISIVKDKLLEKDKFNTGEARKVLEMRALAAKVKAGILTNPNFFVPTLDVTHDGMGIILKGVVHNPKEHKRLEDEAVKLAGDVPVRCELHYRG